MIQHTYRKNLDALGYPAERQPLRSGRSGWRASLRPGKLASSRATLKVGPRTARARTMRTRVCRRREDDRPRTFSTSLAARTRNLDFWSNPKAHGGLRGAFAQNTPMGAPLFRDQLWLADAGNWQIADGSDPRTARARVTSVGDLPISSVSEPQLVPEPCGSLDGRQHGEQDQGARVRPALGACATRPGATPSIC
eukprot:scaffold112005_cov57-Phaeocystis_antarctica.AAC.4